MNCAVKLQLGSASKAMKMKEFTPKENQTEALALDSKYVRANPPSSRMGFSSKKRGVVEFSGNYVQEVRTAFSLRPISYKIFPADAEKVLTILERNSMTKYPGQEWGL